MQGYQVQPPPVMWPHVLLANSPPFNPWTSCCNTSNYSPSTSFQTTSPVYIITQSPVVARQQIPSFTDYFRDSDRVPSFRIPPPSSPPRSICVVSPSRHTYWGVFHDFLCPLGHVVTQKGLSPFFFQSTNFGNGPSPFLRVCLPLSQNLHHVQIWQCYRWIQ